MTEENTINAVFCKTCNCIVYSRFKKDYRSCDCGECSIDGGFDYSRVIADNFDNAVSIKLDKNVLLQQILFYDFKFKNKNAKEFAEGYYGKFILGEWSKKSFYSRLIAEGFDEVWENVNSMYKSTDEIANKTETLIDYKETEGK